MMAPFLGVVGGFCISAFGADLLAGYLGGQSLGSSLLHAGIGALSALAGFGAGWGASFAISRVAGGMTAFNVAHGLIAGITGAAAIGGIAMGVAFPGREWARWIQSTVIPFAGGFGMGVMAGYQYFRGAGAIQPKTLLEKDPGFISKEVRNFDVPE
jgi:hypothetical protein